MGKNELKQLQIIGITQLQQKDVGRKSAKTYPYCIGNCLQTAPWSKNQPGRGRFSH